MGVGVESYSFLCHMDSHRSGLEVGVLQNTDIFRDRMEKKMIQSRRKDKISVITRELIRKV